MSKKTREHMLPILVIIFHYVDTNGKVRRTVAGMKQVSGSKTGENLATVVMEVIRDWEIQHNLGYFIMNNASDNDVMMRHLALFDARESNVAVDIDATLNLSLSLSVEARDEMRHSVQLLRVPVLVDSQFDHHIAQELTK